MYENVNNKNHIINENKIQEVIKRKLKFYMQQYVSICRNMSNTVISINCWTFYKEYDIICRKNWRNKMEKEKIEINVKEKIIKLKDHESVIAYLEFLQNVISRMGGNSDNIKALIAVVYTIFITILIAINELKGYWWIGFVIVVVGMIMDSYYLAFERMYRKKYNNFVKKLNDGQIDEREIYNMNPKNTDLKYEFFAVMLEAVKSFSVIGFYILFICITILLKFI